MIPRYLRQFAYVKCFPLIFILTATYFSEHRRHAVLSYPFSLLSDFFIDSCVSYNISIIRLSLYSRSINTNAKGKKHVYFR